MKLALARASIRPDTTWKTGRDQRVGDVSRSAGACRSHARPPSSTCMPSREPKTAASMRRSRSARAIRRVPRGVGQATEHRTAVEVREFRPVRHAKRSDTRRAGRETSSIRRARTDLGTAFLEVEQSHGTRGASCGRMADVEPLARGHGHRRASMESAFASRPSARCSASAPVARQRASARPSRRRSAPLLGNRCMEPRLTPACRATGGIDVLEPVRLQQRAAASTGIATACAGRS